MTDQQPFPSDLRAVIAREAKACHDAEDPDCRWKDASPLVRCSLEVSVAAYGERIARLAWEARGRAERFDRVVGIAKRIACEAHALQRDTVTGAPYITHVERVVAQLRTPEERAVGWLHDVVEDSSLSFVDLTLRGIPASVVTSVRRLTRDKGGNYADYIDALRVSGDPVAIAVKVADLMDHLRPSCPERLRPRYERALAVLSPAPTSDEPAQEDK